MQDSWNVKPPYFQQQQKKKKKKKQKQTKPVCRLLELWLA